MSNEPEDSESRDGEIDGNNAYGTGVPWYLPREDDGGADEEFDSAEAGDATNPEVAEGPAELGAGILRVWCPECGQELNISREHLGMQGICLHCNLPIVARMSPDDSGGMRVVAAEVAALDRSEAVEERPTESSGHGEVETSGEVVEEISELVPVEAKAEDESDGSVADEEAADLGDSSDEGLDPLLLEGGRYGEEADVKTESEAADDGQSDQSDTSEEPGRQDDNAEPGPDQDAGESEDGDTDSDPSWAKGGNPWNALGLDERKEDETEDEEAELLQAEGVIDKSDQSDQSELSEETDEQADDSLESPGESGDDDEESDAEPDGGEGLGEDLDEEAGLQEKEDSRLGMIIAVVIILVVGGGGLTIFLKPDLIRGSSAAKGKEATEKVAKSDKAEKKAGNEGGKENGVTGPKASISVSDKTDKADEDKMKVASGEPKAIKRPDGKDKKPEVKTEPKPKMARARAQIDDDVALRMHQEGERTIRSFYRAHSVEEKSAFVLEPGQAMESMRSFYDKLGKLPSIRYLEFKGKVLDPNSGLRFGVFDVHEKENEESHRWIVVEIEPGQYALDWGLYEQLENSTLISYLAKEQVPPKEFRLLMKLGDPVSAVDSPWDVETVKVYLQLPSAGSVGGEVVLLKKSAAEKFGILDGLADGKIRIGRVTLGWVGGDKDPGSKAPTITGFDGWGAWTQLKMRGLN